MNEPGLRVPRIAIPEPTADDLEYNRRAWPQYAHAVEASGGIAVMIPLSATPAEVARLASSCEGVLLPGSGADVDPEKYGHERIPECGKADPAREAVDELLMQDAANLYKPLFGICYGLQSWNVWRGGTLVQDLNTGVNHDPGREVIQAHAVAVVPDSRLAVITGVGVPVDPLSEEDQLLVNSSHHQAVDLPGDGLRVVARSGEDGVIEALEGSGEQFVLAVQWHPERTFELDPASKLMFSAFVNAAAKWRPRLIHESVAVSGV
jgi:putative glutamine amidotransferase